MGLTEGEKGFEQTKECYLTEVIQFFKSLKEHFEGIQKALTKEIKEMNDIFEELDVEVDQNVVNRKHDEIERKNLLIANDNLIFNWLSKEVFYIATNSELIVSRFTEMHEAHTIVLTRYLELEAELSNYEIRAENEKVKQHYKELYDSIKITHAKHIEQTNALLTKHENLKAQIHENLKCNIMKSVKLRVLAPRVNCCTNAIGSQPRSNTKKNRISPAKGVNKKKVEERPRINKSNLRTMNRVNSSSSSKRNVINSNSDSVCQTCNKCLISANHDVCVVDYLQYVKASPSIHNIHNVVRKVKQVWKPKQVRQVWKPISKVLTSVGYQWRPTGRIFTLGE
ncbi:hypothetical protein Tco_1525586 [Tanacetum coccineum]